MLNVLRTWMQRYFSNEDAIVLFIFLVMGFVVILTMGKMLAPLIASVIIAFLLQGLVNKLETLQVPHIIAVSIVFVVFISLLSTLLLIILPLVWQQLTALFDNLPQIMNRIRELILVLPQKTDFISETQVQEWLDVAVGELRQLGQLLFSLSIEYFSGIITILIYVVLVPILVFFFLKDREKIARRLLAFLPSEHTLMLRIGEEMNLQIANYIRGKATEILIVGSASYITFTLFGLQYAALLALLVGLSVIIPYIGASLVTLPVAIVAYFQWGWTSDFWFLMVVYFIIQMLDGNVLVPILFSEAVNLHPVVIILAILVFGGLWGFWGVFFAIPLATLLKAVFNAWPRNIIKEQNAAV